MSFSPSHRVFQLADPRPLTVDLHPIDCSCPVCEPYRPSAVRQLTAIDIARQATLSFVAGVTIAVALDPAHAARSLLAIFGVGL